MKVAVIGAGKWGQNLVKNFFEMGVLDTVVEADPATREKLGSTYSGVTFTDDASSVIEGGPEAVAIATPVPTHFEIAERCLKAGKHVFVEKPITVSTAEAKQLAALSKEVNRTLMVGHLLMYQPAIETIKTAMNDGKIGKVHSLSQKRLKLGRVRSVENVLWSFGVHDLAVLFYLAGSAPSSFSVAGRPALQPKIEDDVYLHMNFENQLQAHLHCSWLWPKVERALTIVGSEGFIHYDELEQKVELHKKKILPDLNAQDDGTEILVEGASQPLRLELEHFLDCAKTGATPRSDGESAIAVIDLIERASKEMESQRG